MDIKTYREAMDMEQKRTFLVVKSNDIVQKARFNLSLQQQKILLYAISQIKPSDKPNQTYTIDIPQMCEVCGIDKSSSNIHQIYQNLEEIKKSSFWFKTEGSSKRDLIDWLINVSVIEYSNPQNPKKATPRKISFKFDSRLEGYLFELASYFTRYELINILPMRSAYSVRLYELMCSYAELGGIVIENTELYEMLQIKETMIFAEFRRNVIAKAISEINKFTNLFVTTKLKRTGRTCTAIDFAIKKKTTLETSVAFASGVVAIDSKNNPQNAEMNKHLISTFTDMIIQ